MGTILIGYYHCTSGKITCANVPIHLIIDGALIPGIVTAAKVFPENDLICPGIQDSKVGCYTGTIDIVYFFIPIRYIMRE